MMGKMDEVMLSIVVYNNLFMFIMPFYFYLSFFLWTNCIHCVQHLVLNKSVLLLVA